MDGSPADRRPHWSSTLPQAPQRTKRTTSFRNPLPTAAVVRSPIA